MAKLLRSGTIKKTRKIHHCMICGRIIPINSSTSFEVWVKSGWSYNEYDEDITCCTVYRCIPQCKDSWHVTEDF